jgi:hypothetical protein
MGQLHLFIGWEYMASSSAYIIGPAHYGPKIKKEKKEKKKDYASPPNRSKYNKYSTVGTKPVGLSF